MKYDWRDGNQVDLLINGEEFYPAAVSYTHLRAHET